MRRLNCSRKMPDDRLQQVLSPRSAADPITSWGARTGEIGSDSPRRPGGRQPEGAWGVAAWQQPWARPIRPGSRSSSSQTRGACAAIQERAPGDLTMFTNAGYTACHHGPAPAASPSIRKGAVCHRPDAGAARARSTSSSRFVRRHHGIVSTLYGPSSHAGRHAAGAVLPRAAPATLVTAGVARRSASAHLPAADRRPGPSDLLTALVA
jgi:hypothetical protein